MNIRQQMRSLMIRNGLAARQRQNTMLQRAVASFDLPTDHLSGHTGEIQGKLSPEVLAACSPSHVGLS